MIFIDQSLKFASNKLSNQILLFGTMGGCDNPTVRYQSGTTHYYTIRN